VILRAIALVLLAFPAWAELREVTLDDGRSYLFDAPAGVADPPLILALHGGGGSPSQFARSSGLAPAALRAGFAIAFPAGTARRGGPLLVWNGLYCCGHAPGSGVDDLGFLDRVVADAAVRFGTRGPVFVTGMSNGAILAQTFAATRADRVAALASVAGTMDVTRVRVAGPVRVLHIHGTADAQVPFAGGRGSEGYTDTAFTPVLDSLAAFAAPHGRLTRSSREEDPTRDGRSLRITEWSKAGEVRITLIAVQGGPHEWPGSLRARRSTRDVDATDAVIRFFSRWRQ
jgi:polyhydroxybutyrate depolymerase